MKGFLELSGGVNTGADEDENDVIATKKALQDSGDYRSPGGRISGWRDSDLDAGLKKVQIRNGIWPDGRMRPGGPTHRIINAEAQERRNGKKPNSIGLQSSVGTHAGNRPDDIRTWRHGLATVGNLPMQERTRPGKAFDQQTDWATRRFQTDFNRKPDGLVNPSGETDRMMARVVAPMRNSLRARSGNQPTPVSGTSRTMSSTVAKQKRQPSEVEHFRSAARSPVFRPDMASVPSTVPRRSDGQRAKDILRSAASLSRWAVYKHAPDNLEHFLDGFGMDREIPLEAARLRDPVRIGEPINRKGIEDSLFRYSTSQGNVRQNQPLPADADELANLKDGQVIKLSDSQNHEEITSFGGAKSRHNISQDEHLATGRTSVTAKVPEGLTAVRTGNRIVVFGTVAHRWEDKYDFEPGGLSNLAISAREENLAHQYKNISHWRQGFRAELVIKNGRLTPVTFEWEDQNQAADLK